MIDTLVATESEMLVHTPVIADSLVGVKLDFIYTPVVLDPEEAIYTPEEVGKGWIVATGR